MEYTSLIFSVLAFIFSVLNLIELRAQKLSTHQVQFVDPHKEWEKELEQINTNAKESNDLDSIY